MKQRLLKAAMVWVFLSAAFITGLQAQIYSYTTATNGSSASVAANATGTGLSRVNGATAPSTPCGTGYSVTNFSSTATYSTSLAAVEFTVTPNAGYVLNVTGFSAGLRRSSSGPASVRYAYSTNGGTSWTDQGSNQSPSNTSCGTTTTGSWSFTATVASGSSIKIRLYGFNASSTSGTFQILNATLNGTVTASCTPPSLSSSITDVTCNGNSDGAIDLTTAGGSSPFTYAWTKSGSSFTASTEDISGLAAGTYNVTVTAMGGCTATASYTVNEPAALSPIITNESACDSYTWSVNNQTYTNSGIYNTTVGCQPYVLNLTIIPVTSNTTTITACGSYTWPVNNQTYMNSGTYTSVSGCNTEILNLTISNVTVTANACTIACSGGTTTVTVSATGGTAPYTGTGSFTVGAGTYTYTVTDANGCTGSATVTVSVAADVTPPSLYLLNNNLLSGITGTSSSQSPYLLPAQNGVQYKSILTANDAVGGYKMAGIPDGLGAFDNGDGTFTLLMNHEISNTLGATRAHGSKGAFVSKWIINKNDLSVVSGSDLIQTVNLWNGSGYTAGTTAFSRFCSADLPSASALYNCSTGNGTQERIFMNGEESGTEGRAMAHIVTGPNAGTSYQLPYLGKMAFENVVASPSTGDKTVVGCMDDGTGGQVYFYIGTKKNTGTEIDKAGLSGGKQYGVKITGFATERVNSTTINNPPTAGTTFSLVDLGDVSNITGTQFNTNSVNAGVTSFSRPEDGAWDPSNPNDFYFNTTDQIDQVNDGVGTQVGRTRVWKLHFTDISNPELGGTVEAVIDGTEGANMLDNMAIDKTGHIILLEDVGNSAHNGKVWQYTIATDQLTMIGKHDPARFGDIGVAATSPFSQDEETSGVIDVSDILGAGMFLIVDQAHYSTGIPSDIVEGGQLLSFFNPASAGNGDAKDTVRVTANSGCTATGVSLGTPATYDNCSVASITNDAPSAFPVGTTNVTWTVTDGSGNTATATQIVIVTDNISPTITAPADVTAGTNNVTCDGAVSANLGTPVTSDNCSVASVTNNAPSTFPVGTTTVTWTVTDGSGNTATATQTVTVTQVSASSVANGTILCNGGTTTVTVSATGGTAPYTGTGTFTVGAGTYNYTVTDANGCTSSTSVTVTQPAALVVSASAGTISCNGGTTTVTVNATGGAAPYIGTGTFSNVAAGTYTYTVTDANGCSSSQTITIIQPSKLTVTLNVSGAIACQGGTTNMTVSASGGTPPYNGTGTFTVSAGARTYTVTDANGCTASASFNLNDGTGKAPTGTPSVIVLSQRFNVCNSTITCSINRDVADAAFYTWTAPAGTTIVSGQGTKSITLSASGSFVSGTVSVAAANACGTGPARVSAIIYGKPTTPVISGAACVSANQSGIVYTITSPEPGVTYTWKVPGQARITSGQGTSSITVDWKTSSGTITCIPSNSCATGGRGAFAVTVGCTATAKTITNSMIVYPNPTSDKATILFTANTEAKYSVLISDIPGKTYERKDITAMKGQNKVAVDMSKYANGTYLISLVDENGFVVTRKLVKVD